MFILLVKLFVVLNIAFHKFEDYIAQFCQHVTKTLFLSSTPLKVQYNISVHGFSFYFWKQT